MLGHRVGGRGRACGRKAEKTSPVIAQFKRKSRPNLERK